jgi:hypothetical protein
VTGSCVLRETILKGRPRLVARDSLCIVFICGGDQSAAHSTSVTLARSLTFRCHASSSPNLGRGFYFIAPRSGGKGMRQQDDSVRDEDVDETVFFDY